MFSFTNIFRIITIFYLCSRYGLLRLIFNSNNIKQNKLSRGERIRITLEKLGPIFVKFGQILSTRRDLLADDIACELIKLQDKVPPFANKKAIEIVEKAFKEKTETIFAKFNPIPLAAASIAQVHEATLLNGKQVVVKILRPNIKSTIAKDISLLYFIATVLKLVWPEAKRLKPTEVVAEIENTIYKELDLMREAANASQLKRNFENSNILYIPEVYWDFCHTNVMVMEKISGIPVTNIEKLKAQGTDLKQLAERGVEIFFTQVFRDRFFHADMHAGNIFVSSQTPETPKYIAVDFGIVGTLTPEDQHYLAYNLLAFFKRDYRQVAQLHVESGWVPKSTRIDEFESAIRTVCEPIFEKPLKDISFGLMLLRLFQTARTFSMNIQPQLILLQKTLLNIEGMGRSIYPELNLWLTAKPFLEKWLNNQIGLRALWRETIAKSPYWLTELSGTPEKLLKTIESVQNQPKLLAEQNIQLKNIYNELARKNRRTKWFFIMMLSILGSAQILIYQLYLSGSP